MAGKVKRAKMTVRSAARPQGMPRGSLTFHSHFTSWALGLFPLTSQTLCGALGQHCVQGGFGGRPLDAVCSEALTSTHHFQMGHTFQHKQSGEGESVMN